MFVHAHADNLHVRACNARKWRRSVSAVEERPCTPPSTVVAGLLRKMRMMNNYECDTKIVKSRVSGFSRAKLETGLGSCIARDESKSCCCVFSRPS